MGKGMIGAVIIISIIMLSFSVNSEKAKISKEVYENLDGETRVVIYGNIDKINVDEKIDANKAIASVNEQELIGLQSNPNVQAVYYDYPIHGFLQQATSIVNASSSWNLKIGGSNLTGLGETVCIIDTGINYTHPDLGGCTQSDFLAGNCAKVLGGFDFVNNDNNPYDDNGHGTHVAGIVAGAIIGTARDSKIISIKVLDSTGTGYTSDITKGINWCVGNASLYNISVISMSLGTSDLFGGYCDSIGDFSGIKTAVDSAIAKNISVIASSGNDGNYSRIASPACLENSTSVGASYDDNLGSKTWCLNSGCTRTCTDASTQVDGLACFSNRNNVTDLFAPGAITNSTWLTGYASTQGTSMATPMVAGAFLIIRQYKELENSTITPLQIQTSLNNTGARINDSQTGLNYTRIDIYNSITNLDNYSPAIYLERPSNNTSFTNGSQTFSCNTSDLQLSNLTIRIYNSTLYYNKTEVVSGFFEQKNWSLNLSEGSYLWNCYSCDLKNNCVSSSNFSLTISSIISGLITSNNSRYRTTSNLSCNASSTSQLTNLTFYLWGNSASYNETKAISGLQNSTNFTLNFTQLNLSNGEYSWNCLAGNNLSVYSFFNSNYSLTYDNSVNMSLISPVNRSWYDGLRLNASLNETGTCWFSLNGNANISFETNYSNTTLVEGIHNAFVYCNDSLGNLNMSIITFNVDTTKPNITLISPTNQYSVTSNLAQISFQFSVSDNLSISSCKVILDDVTLNSTEMANGTNTISRSVSPGTYSWSINCSDIAGNEGNSSSRVIVINRISTSSSTNTGGGSTTSSVNETPIDYGEVKINEGYALSLGVSDKLSFKLGNETNYLIIREIGILNITFEINNKTFNLREGEQLNISIGDYSVNVKVNWVSGARTNIKIETLLIENKAEEQGKLNSWWNSKKYISLNNIIIVISIIIVATGIIFGVKYAKKKRKKH